MANNKKIDRKKESKINNVSKRKSSKKKNILKAVGRKAIDAWKKLNKKKIAILLSIPLVASEVPKCAEKLNIFDEKTDNIYEGELELQNYYEAKYNKYKEVLDKAGYERGEEDEKIYKQMKHELEQKVEYETVKTNIENDLKEAIKKAGAENIDIFIGGYGEENFISIIKDGKSQSYDKHMPIIDNDKISKDIPREVEDAVDFIKVLDKIIYRIEMKEDIDLTGKDLAKYLDVLQRGIEIDKKIKNSEITIDDDFNMKVKQRKNKVVKGKNVEVDFMEGNKVKIQPIATKVNNYQNDNKQISQRDDMEIG